MKILTMKVIRTDLIFNCDNGEISKMCLVMECIYKESERHILLTGSHEISEFIKQNSNIK